MGLAAGAVALIAVSTARAAPPVHLRNELSPGVLSVYSLHLSGTRTVFEDDGQVLERAVYEHDGRLTLYGLAAPVRGRAEVVWMLALDEARILSLDRRGREVTPLPRAAMLGLPQRTAHLTVRPTSTAHLHASAEGTGSLHDAALLLALDVMHWPGEAIHPGSTWRHGFSYEPLAGSRQFELLEVAGRGRQRVAEVSSTVTDPVSRGELTDVQVERTESRCQWHLSDHLPDRIESTVELSYSGPQDRRRLTTTLELERLFHRELSRSDRKAVAAELEELTAAVGLYTAARRKEAVAALRRFEPDHPESIWLPVARDLLVKARYEGEKLASLGAEQLSSVLIQLISRWQMAAVMEDPDRLAPLRNTFAELARLQTDALRKLAEGADSNLRAIALFCLAHDPDPAHRRLLLEACSDPEPRVRAWAIYGLAEQASVETELRLFEQMLRDEDANVRQRTCQAIAACAGHEPIRRDQLVSLLLEVVAADTAKPVRDAGVSALVLLADSSHLATLRHRRDTATSKEGRARLNRVIGMLEEGADR